MDNSEERIEKSVKTRKLLTTIIIVFLLVGAVLSTGKLPVSMAEWFVPFKVEEPTYIPIESDKKYSNVIGLDRVKLVYENPNETLTLWATTKIGWNVVSNWDERITLPNGITGHYDEHDDVKMLSWRKGKVEYAIDYKGQNLSKEDLIEVAISLK
jgi:hypothetical protein